MKNMKKIVTAFVAAAMAMSMGISVMAETVVPAISADRDVLNLGTDITTGKGTYTTMMAYVVPGIVDEAPAYDEKNHTMIALDQVDGATGIASVPVDANALKDGNTIVVKISGTNGVLDEYLITMVAETPATPYYLGDVDGNGKITIVDYNQILLKVKRKTPDYAVGETFTTASGTEFVLGDVDGNGKITIVDYNQVLLKVKRKTPDYPVGEEIK